MCRSLAVLKSLTERLHVLYVLQRSETYCMPTNSQHFDLNCSVWWCFAYEICFYLGLILSHLQARLLSCHCSSLAVWQLLSSPCIMHGLHRHHCSVTMYINPLGSLIPHRLYPQVLYFKDNFGSATILTIVPLTHAKSNM